MAINRYLLVDAIISAYQRNDYNTYHELLGIFYKLLEQEDINDIFLHEFNTYDIISEPAKELLGINPV